MRKIGLPIKLSTAPTGMSEILEIIRDARSHEVNISAPTIMAAGITMRLSEPITILAICGDTRPTNPIVPV